MVELQICYLVADYLTIQMIIKDTDPDSPSLDEFVIGEL